MILVRTCCVLVGVALLSAPAARGLEDVKKDAVKEIDLKGFNVKRTALKKVDEPAVLKDEEGLAKLFEGTHPLKANAKAVDFKTQQLLFFGWSGSGGDQLKVVPGEKEIVFEYVRGKTDDVRAHFRLFAIPKDARYKIKTVE